MDVAYISAMSALAGSVIGGLTSGFTTWLSQRAQARAGQLAQDKSRREDLYREFIIAGSKTAADALMHDQPAIEDIVALYAMVSRMRMLSSERIVASAETLMDAITDAYFAPNITIQQIHDLVKSHKMDPMKDFSEAARDELRSIPLL